MRGGSTLLLCLAAALAAPVISPESSRAAKEKLDRIAALQLPSGSSLVLSEDEINAYLRYDYASRLPAGVTQPRIRLDVNRVSGQALVDFLEWRAARGASPGFLLSLLLRGKRRVDVTCRYTSSGGYGQADIESVKVGGVALSAGAVSFLVENVVQPRYSAAVVGRPVALGYNLQQVRAESGRAVLTAR